MMSKFRVSYFCFLTLLFFQGSCSLVQINSEYGLLHDGSHAERIWLKDLDFSKELSTWLDQSSIAKQNLCAQKLAYHTEKSSDVVIEIHQKPCAKSALNQPIMTARWRNQIDEDGHYKNSQFFIGDRIVGETVEKSETIAFLCNVKFTNACEFYNEKGATFLRLK